MTVETRSLAASGRWGVASPHALASEVGADVLRDGGNAVDAALAAAAVLAVVLPNQCAIGGDLIALVGLPDGSAHVLNASGRAPAGVDVDALRARGARLPVDGGLSVTVPGIVDGWHELAQRWGSRPTSTPIAHAAAVAREGSPVSAGLARDITGEELRILADPGLSQVLAPGGTLLREGQTLRQPRLADTLEVIAVGGRDAFYTGDVASSLASTLRTHGSAMTTEDFSAHTSTLEEPLGARFGDEEYVASGGNTQGGFFLAALRAVESLGRRIDPLGPEAGLLSRIQASMGALRDARLGDPTTAPRLDAAEIEHLAMLALAGRTPPVRSQGPAPGGDTVAIVAADASGQWVSIIQSVFHAFGSGLLDPVTGVLLHNRGAAFELAPDSAAALAGGHRPPHTLMPVLVRDAGTGRLVAAHGSMGGRAQAQIHTHLALHLALGRTARDAVSAPRWLVGQMEAGGDETPVVHYEQDVPDEARRSLAGTAVPMKALPVHDDGAGHAQVIRSRGGRLDVATDPRADGAALTDES
jgi:gamma-glutamyltranspeptidase/glutathione hydrolase